MSDFDYFFCFPYSSWHFCVASSLAFYRQFSAYSATKFFVLALTVILRQISPALVQKINAGPYILLRN